MSSDLSALFAPRSIAVVGASRAADAIGHRLFGNLHATFGGPVYAINPRANEIAGQPAYASIQDVPGPVDLALLVVPAPEVVRVAEQCAAHAVRAIVVISAGFAEAGAAGVARETELRRIVQASGMRMVGPNSFGIISHTGGVNLWGTFGDDPPQRGNIAFASQSGALGHVFPQYCRQWNLGLSAFVSLGNKGDIDENDLLEYWGNDVDSQTILLYLESFKNPRRFLQVSRTLTRRKPLVVLKAGRTPAGQRAAASHTAALAGATAIGSALLEQSGAIQVADFRSLFETAALLATQPLPRGRRVALLTNAGGPAVLCADALEGKGLELPEFSASLQAKLRVATRPEVATLNPIDLVASVDSRDYAACLSLLADSNEVDALVGMFVPRTAGSLPAVARAMNESARHLAGRLPVAAVFMPSLEAIPEVTRSAQIVPYFDSPEGLAAALAHAVHHAEHAARPTGRGAVLADAPLIAIRGILAKARSKMGPGGGWLGPVEVEQVLTALKIPSPQNYLVQSEQEAVDALARIGGSVVLKNISPTCTHKTDAGGVRINISSASDVRQAYRQVHAAAPDTVGVLVQRFAPQGLECLIGALRDPQFGPIVTFGLGGTYVQLLGDAAIRLVPLTDLDAVEMMKGTKAWRLLQGYRGSGPMDIGAVQQTLLRISALATAVPEMIEVDLNPVNVLSQGRGVLVLDARIRWGSTPEPEPAAEAH